MKTIGNTREGKLIVEMSNQEHETFEYLEAAVDGLTQGTLFSEGVKALRGLDLSDTLSAIKLYVESRFYANELRKQADMLDSLLTKK